MNEQAMVDGQVVLSTNRDVAEQPITVCEEVKGLNHGAVGRILEGNDRIVHLVRLERSEDIGERSKRVENSLAPKAFKGRLSFLLAARFPANCHGGEGAAPDLV